MIWKTTARVLATVVALGSAAHATNRITPPAVPVLLEVDAAYKPFLVAHAVGTQNYICAPAATVTGVAWLPIGPQATVFNAEGEQALTHFLSKNPIEGDALHATWQHSRDTSVVWGKKRSGSSDPNYVAADAIEWLLLDVTGTQTGPSGGDKLAGTKFIQRVNTIGGMAPPAAECTPSTVNTRKFVAYEADYYFYE